MDRKGKGDGDDRGWKRDPRNANIVSFHFAIRRGIILRRSQYFHRFIAIAVVPPPILNFPSVTFLPCRFSIARSLFPSILASPCCSSCIVLRKRAKELMRKVWRSWFVDSIRSWGLSLVSFVFSLKEKCGRKNGKGLQEIDL